MIGENNRRADYPTGTKVVLQHQNTKLAFHHDVMPLQTVGTIINYIIWGIDGDDYDEITVLWENGQATSILLMNVIHADKVDAFKKEQLEFREIKFAIRDSYAYGDWGTRDGFEIPKHWLELDMEFDRKIALLNAGVPLKNIHLYDTLTTDEIKSLKHHLQALEGR